MNPNNLTIKSQEIFQKAQQLALHNPRVVPRLNAQYSLNNDLLREQLFRRNVTRITS